jgi:uncharacterized protein with PIN domain
VRLKLRQNKVAEIRFYEELNDFLPKEKQKKSFNYRFSGNPTIKDAIEACGVPHPEVEIILVNGISEGFDYHLKDGDRVSIYPLFESLDITRLIKLRDKPLRKTIFIVDVNLGRFARYLRMLGFDTLYNQSHSNQDIIRLSLLDGRIILTRDRNLLKHKIITHGYWLRSSDPFKQLSEIIKRLDLLSSIHPFIRCMACNGLLNSVSKINIVDLIPPKIAEFHSEFYQCSDCQKIYWPGSHFIKMQDKIERLKKELSII